MRQVVIVVEGSTEEAFVNGILAPRVSPTVHLLPVVVPTSATPTRTYKGGGRWKHYQEVINKFSGQPHWAKIGLLIDYYRFPKDGPGAGGPYGAVAAAVQGSSND